jgi:hypothetical protein
MPKQQNAQSKPPHRPARRKSKPKFDVPAEVGEPSTASWVYREDGPPETSATAGAGHNDRPSEMPIETPAATAAATVAEAIAAPIAQAIEVAAAVAPERSRYPPPVEEPVHPEPSSAFGNPVRFAAMGLLGMSVGIFEFFTTAAFKVMTIPFGLARRLMPD